MFLLIMAVPRALLRVARVLLLGKVWAMGLPWELEWRVVGGGWRVAGGGWGPSGGPPHALPTPELS